MRLRRAAWGAFLLLSLLNLRQSDALRGLGLPHKELFFDSHERGLLEASTAAPAAAAAAAGSGAPAQEQRSTARSTAASPPASPNNATESSGMTLSGLEEELKEKADKLHDAEEHHSKATIAVAATLGSLLLLVLAGCAGMLAYKCFVNSQHAGAHKKSAASRLPYYDADRLLGDNAATL